MINNAETKAVLVTGGAGFIGSHLCRKLLQMGYEVFCLDNFCDFYDPGIKRNNIAGFLQNRNFTLLEQDLRDRQYLHDLFSAYSFNTIIHLAAMAGVRPSIENPKLYYDININGTYNLLECVARTARQKPHLRQRFIFASSSSVYGNNKKIPFSENDPVDNPISPYAVTKKTGELICFNFHHLYKIPVICLRFFTVYGPGQRPDLAIRKFAEKMLKDETISLFGDGKSKRDYTYIDDIIQGVIKAVEYFDRLRLLSAAKSCSLSASKSCSPAPLRLLSASKSCSPAPTTPKRSEELYQSDGSAVNPSVKTAECFEIFNLGESKTISLSEMIETLEDCIGKRAKINYLPAQPGDVEQTFADISKSRNMLGYNPVFDFSEGIKLFVDWLKKQ